MAIGLLTMASCKDDVSLNDFGNKPELVVYAFPSTADTTYINVTRSLPVNKYSKDSDLVGISNATVTYYINGKEQAVVNRGDGYYYVVAKQKAGDKISINVSAKGLPDAGGETVIPDSVPLGTAELNETRLYNSDYSEMQDYYQLSAEFTDPAKTHDYYIPRIRLKCSGYNIDMETDDTLGIDTINFYPNVNSQNEPLITTLSKIDADFGFSNDNLSGLCVFNDATINGMTYKLHLNTEVYNPFYPQALSREYRIELLHITPELYNFLNSLNAISNSDFAKHGLSQIAPTASNVHGGFGIIAGWNISRSNYVSVTEE